MYRIVILRGGLGNQMFGYAFYLTLKQRYRFSFVGIDPIHCFLVHNGFELPDIFSNIHHKKSFKFYRRIQKLYSEYSTKKLFMKVMEESPGKFLSTFANTNYFFTVYDGFWQTEKYFENIRSNINFAFQFNKTKLNFKTEVLCTILEKENGVSIHIRRGDYVDASEFDGICNLNYYKNALEKIEKLVKDPKYYIFTDDKVWVSDNISLCQYQLIDWNNNTESWQDMYLMTKCKHNIIANSSFSWWGAWLNNNEEKIVIAPSKWFKTLSAEDITPESWIRI